jgi:hypothetical protein
MKKNMSRVFYLPYSEKSDLFLICFPSKTKAHHPRTSEQLTLEVLSDTTLHLRKEMPDILKKLKHTYPDIRAVKITLTFTKTNLIG